MSLQTIVTTYWQGLMPGQADGVGYQQRVAELGGLPDGGLGQFGEAGIDGQ
ncbi:hypothetical protein [Micromonospora sp. RTGN7]|uniref:hypothetical protein n=1 Tax=Micromonospora sp. RTGN7 TaxID=3016526 RepID=UPI0029FF46C4|nr:hypothetical protein [Micromonospora sp. RTGN7]